MFVDRKWGWRFANPSGGSLPPQVLICPPLRRRGGEVAVSTQGSATSSFLPNSSTRRGKATPRTSRPPAYSSTPPFSPSSVAQQLQTEIRIHRTLDHEHIVKFHHFFEDKHHAYILLELCHNHVRTPLPSLPPPSLLPSFLPLFFPPLTSPFPANPSQWASHTLSSNLIPFFPGPHRSSLPSPSVHVRPYPAPKTPHRGGGSVLSPPTS